VSAYAGESLLSTAYSPCPNDTFVFHAWSQGLLNDAPAIDVTFADIDVTNDWASRDASHDLLKISHAALPYARACGYHLLDAGGALGRGCGPLVLDRGESDNDPLWLAGRRIAVPSLRSTAYLLMRFWLADLGVGEPDIVVMPFPEIMPAVAGGLVDAGLVIHEARFTYRDHGLNAITDLGEWWEYEMGLPIPLGAIVVRDGLDRARLDDCTRASVEYAWAHPDASRAYIAANAQEMDATVQQRHIDLYVNEFTRGLGDEGREAVTALLALAREAELVPECDPFG
jgi:1,4-dihydroxy-6-naphthoate synthase